MENKEHLVPQDVLNYREHCGKINPMLLAEKLGIKLHLKQEEICRNFLRENRDKWDYYSVLAGRRFGKSFLMRILALAELLTPSGRVVFITPTMRLAEKHFLFILKALKKFPEMEGQFNALKQKLTIEIDMLDSSLMCASFDSWDDRVTGDALTFVIYDEIYLANAKVQDDMMETIEPTTATYGTYPSGAMYGKTLALGTPRGTKTGTRAGQNHIKAMSNNKDFNFYKGSEYTVYDNPLVTAETIERLKSKMSKAKFDREFLVKFEGSNTQIFRNFDEVESVVDINRIDELKNRDNLFLIIAFDYGFTKDPDGNTYMLYDDTTGKYYLVAESSEQGRATKKMYEDSLKTRDYIVNKFNISKNNIFYIGDIANIESIRIGISDFDFEFMKIKKDREKGFEAVNDKLSGHITGDRLFFVDKSCTEAIRQLSTAEYKVVGERITDDYATDSNGTHFDLCDCIRYTIFNIDRLFRQTKIIVA